VPTGEDWDTLQDYLISHGYNYDNTTTGNKIAKSLAAQEDWLTSTNSGAVGNNLAKNNCSGFSALPAGTRCGDGTFDAIGSRSCFWSSTEASSSEAYYRYLSYGARYLYRSYYHTSCGFSVRCVKD